MSQITLPPRPVMLEAFLASDASCDGLFVTAVRTTGIFCRPGCRARKPNPDNVEFLASPREAVQAGYRPCLRCRPMEPASSPPPWLRPLIDLVEEDPSRRWTDADLRTKGYSPRRVSRWFQQQHGMTFHGYQRSRRLGAALSRIQKGQAIPAAAYSHGYESLSGFNEAFRKALGAPPSALRAVTMLTVDRITTPLGSMLAAATDESLYLLEFIDRRMLQTQLQRLRSRLSCTFVRGGNEILAKTEEEIAAWFDGTLRSFTVPISTPGSSFQRAVWEKLRELPYGATTSYGALARDLGRPTAARAVARANGDNRIAIIIPCHRVIGENGALTGYGGGLWRKHRLLELEKITLETDSPPGPIETRRCTEMHGGARRCTEMHGAERRSSR